MSDGKENYAAKAESKPALPMRRTAPVITSVYSLLQTVGDTFLQKITDTQMFPHVSLYEATNIMQGLGEPVASLTRASYRNAVRTLMRAGLLMFEYDVDAPTTIAITGPMGTVAGTEPSTLRWATAQYHNDPALVASVMEGRVTADGLLHYMYGMPDPKHDPRLYGAYVCPTHKLERKKHKWTFVPFDKNGRAIAGFVGPVLGGYTLIFDGSMDHRTQVMGMASPPFDNEVDITLAAPVNERRVPRYPDPQTQHELAGPGEHTLAGDLASLDVLLSHASEIVGGLSEHTEDPFRTAFNKASHRNQQVTLLALKMDE